MEATQHTMETAPVKATEIAFWRVGQGRPLVVVHGGPGTGHAYMRGLDVLAEGRQLVHYDQRGSGETALGDAGLVTFAGAIADLDGVIDALGEDSVDLLGHSLGAWIAILYAAAHPERVGSLVLAHTGPPAIPELMQRFGAEMESRRMPEDKEAMGRIQQSTAFADRDPATLEELFRLRYAPFFRDRANTGLFEPRFTALTAENVLQFPERMMRDFPTHDPIGSLARVCSPALVVHGELDAIPQEFAQLLADRIPGSRLALIPGASHFSFLEDPAAFLEVVEAFLADQA